MSERPENFFFIFSLPLILPPQKALARARATVQRVKVKAAALPSTNMKMLRS